VGVVNPNEDDGERLADSAGINTRRQFMAGSAGALGGLALGGAFVGSGAAQMDDEKTAETAKTAASRSKSRSKTSSRTTSTSSTTLERSNSSKRASTRKGWKTSVRRPS